MMTNINCLQLFSNFPVTFSQTWCLFTIKKEPEGSVFNCSICFKCGG